MPLFLAIKENDLDIYVSVSNLLELTRDNCYNERTITENEEDNCKDKRLLHVHVH